MTTSGTSTFNRTRDQLCMRALRQCNAVSSGETPDAQTITDAAEALNAMVKEWHALGIHIWTETEGIVWLQSSQVSYTFGSGSTDNATEVYAQTTLSSSAASGATSISVSSATGIVATYNIGVLLTSGSLFWTTVSSVAGTAVTLASALTGAAASGNAVVAYQTKINRPLRIVAARRYLMSSQIETPMMVSSRLDYRDLPSKITTGTPTQYFYDPRGGANVAGQIYVWPAPVDARAAIKFSWYRQIQDFNNPGDTPDLPQEWLNALTWNLAQELAAEYAVPPPLYQMIRERAAVSLDRVTGWDKEPESIFFGVSDEYR